MKVRSGLLYALAFVTFSSIGCGGGGGGGGGQQPLYQIPYTGISNDALITPSNAERIAWGAFSGPDIPLGNVSPLGAESNRTSPARQWNAIPGFLQSMIRNGLKRSVDRPHPKSPSPSASVTDQWTEPGPCGGTASYSVTVNDVTGDFTGSVTFTGYNDCEFVMTGSTNISGNVDPGMLTYRWLQLHIGIITVVSGEESLSLSGTVLFDWQVYPSTATMHLRVRDDGTGEVFWYEDYVTTVGMSGSYQEMTVSGKYYDSAYGCVTLTTEKVFRSLIGMTYPSEGTMRAAGANRTVSWLIAVNEALYRVEADTDGDGVVEYTGPNRHWPGVNTIPYANAGADQTAPLGTRVTMSGSGSDADGDPITFHWSFASVPSGSSTVLSDPSAASPSFTPDFDGTYVLRLVVNDGISSSPPALVSVTADLFAQGFRILAPGYPVEAVAIGDVDNDGRNDVVAVTGFSSNVANDFKLLVFLQGSDGTLLPRKQYDTSVTYYNTYMSVSIGDVNGDGLQDVVVGEFHTGIEVFLQDGSGGLLPPVFYPSPNSGMTRIADFNSDGRMDVVGIGWGDSNADILYQNPGGTLNAPVPYPVKYDGRGDFKVGDINHDGLTDVIVTSGQGDPQLHLALVYQQAGGGLAAPVYFTYGGSHFGRALGVGDVTGDNLADVVMTVVDVSVPGDPSSLGVFAQDSSGSLTVPVLYAGFPPSAIEIKDLNRDGREDVVGVRNGILDLVYLQGKDGKLYHNKSYGNPEGVFNNPLGIATGDVNGDGLDDVVIAHSYGMDVYYNQLNR